MKTKRRNLFGFSLLIFVAMIFTWNSCTKQEEIRTDDLITHEKILNSENSLESKIFDKTVERLRRIYPLESNLDMRGSSTQTTCGPEDDEQIEC